MGLEIRLDLPESSSEFAFITELAEKESIAPSEVLLRLLREASGHLDAPLHGATKFPQYLEIAHLMAASPNRFTTKEDVERYVREQRDEW